MRDYKFRAWDNKAKEWLMGYNLPNLGGFSMFGECMMFEQWSDVLSRFILNDIDRKHSDLILMQYTGLKDKNGKEIYEGDIVNYDNGISKGVYVFDGGSFKIKGTNTLSSTTSEVIGNIHENPELLNA